MTRDELIARLKAYEWTDLECKKARAQVPKDAYSTVSAFANTQGGWLLFGVSEKAGELNITGVDPKAFDAMQNDFLSTLRSGQKINHIVYAEPHVFELDGERILAFYIPEMDRRQKPVYLNGDTRETYIRRGASDERATGVELQRMLRDSSPRPWDSEALIGVDPAGSIDAETLDWYQQQFARRNPEQKQFKDALEFLEEWNFVIRENGDQVLTRAAVLLFGTDRAVRALLPRPVLDYQRIDTRFENWSAEERWHDRLVFEENLFKTWRGLVAKYSRIAEHPFSIDPSTLRRNDDPPDYIAFREAAINLLIHQDYGDQHRKASIKWFTDRLVFWNPGNAFASTTQLLEAGEQDIRNPLIVNAFRRIGLSDQAGTGIRTIVRNWRELGRLAPQISNDKAGNSFELVLQQEELITPAMQQFQQQLGVNLNPAQAAILAQAAAEPVVHQAEAAMISGLNPPQLGEALDYLCHQQLLQPLPEGGYGLTGPIRALLQKQRESSAIGQPGPTAGPRSGPGRDQLGILRKCLKEQAIPELMELVGRTNRTKFRDQVLKPMMESGWIEMTIPDKPTSSKQRYRTTQLGQQVLEQHT